MQVPSTVSQENGEMQKRGASISGGGERTFRGLFLDLERNMAIKERDILAERKKKEKEWERELQDRFNADSKDIIAFSVAAWQLFIPLVVALLIVGLIMIFLLSLL